jgi:hypothetical protein
MWASGVNAHILETVEIDKKVKERQYLPVHLNNGKARGCPQTPKIANERNL